MGQPSLTAFEPAYVDELAEILRWSFEHLQEENGGSVYLRLSTRPMDQPPREMTPELSDQILRGGYWLVEPAPDAEMAIVVSGPPVREALEALDQLAEDVPGAGLLVATSPDRLHRDWLASRRNGAAGGGSHIERLLGRLAPDAGLVTLLDGHPAALSWVGAATRLRVVPLGIERFGQSGNIPDLYHAYAL